MYVLIFFDATVIETYHCGRLDDLTRGDIPSLYNDLVLLKFTMLNIILCSISINVHKNMLVHLKAMSNEKIILAH